MIRDGVSRQIAGTPERVWSLVANVTRMAEWSPTAQRVEWVGDASGPEIGARFRGHNRQSGVRWSRECVITTCEPGRELTFETVFHDAPSTRWQYRFEPSDGGTRATESYEVLSMPRWVRAMRRVPGMVERSHRDARSGMELTLERMASIAEAEQ